MTAEPQDLKVENALLRASLWITARRLKDYQEAPATKFEQDDREMLQLTIPALLRESAAEALAKAQEMLKDEGEREVTRWTICFADREYARSIGDPDLGQVEAETQDDAIEKAWAEKEIARRASGRCAGLWAYVKREEQKGRIA